MFRLWELPQLCQEQQLGLAELPSLKSLPAAVAFVVVAVLVHLLDSRDVLLLQYHLLIIDSRETCMRTYR